MFCSDCFLLEHELLVHERCHLACEETAYLAFDHVAEAAAEAATEEQGQRDQE